MKVNEKFMSNTIVIPDIHQNIYTLQDILNKPSVQDAEEVVFLGDYFDSFEHDDLLDETIEFLNENIENDRYIFLIGNHDVHYFCDVQDYICSGFSKEKKNTIKKKLDPAFLHKKVRALYYKEFGNFPCSVAKGYLFSHAGIHPKFLHPNFDILLKEGGAKEYFENYSFDIIESIVCNIPNLVLGAGYDRGGRQEHGGITWLDWYSFVSISEFKQIVGHSRMTIPSWNNGNLNLDTGLKYFLDILTTPEFKTKIEKV
jgi:hypothetical protein